MPFTPEQKREIVAYNGYSPDDFGYDEDSGQILPLVNKPRPVEVSTGGAAFKGAQSSVGPAIGGTLGTILALQGLNLVAPGSGLLASIPVVLGGAYGGSKLGGAAQDALTTDEFKQSVALAQQQHPYAFTAGSFAPDLLTFRPGLSALKGTARAARNLAAGAEVAAPDVAHAAGLATQTGATGYELAKEYEETGTIDPIRAAMLLAGGSLMADFNAPTRRLANKLGRPIFSESEYRGDPDYLRTGKYATEFADTDPSVLTIDEVPVERPLSERIIDDPQSDKLAAAIEKGRISSARADAAEQLRLAKQKEKYTAVDITNRAARVREILTQVINDSPLPASTKRRQLGQIKNASDESLAAVFDDVTATTRSGPAAEAGKVGDVTKATGGTTPSVEPEVTGPSETGRLEVNPESLQEAITRGQIQRAPDVRSPLYSNPDALSQEPLSAPTPEPKPETDIIQDRLDGVRARYSKPPPVPEPAGVIDEQLRLAADPDSSRAAVLVTPGAAVPPTPEGMSAVSTKHGLVIYNPAKTSEAAVIAAGRGADFDARLLGMSQPTKPGGPEEIAVTADTPAARNVSAEVVEPESVPDAVAAAEAANPGAEVSVKPVEEVLAARRALLSTGTRRGLDVTDVDVDRPYTTPDDPTLRYGRYIPLTESAAGRLEASNAESVAHELLHDTFYKLSPERQKRLLKVVEGSEEYKRSGLSDPEEFLTTYSSGDFLRRMRETDFSAWRDLIRTARLRLGLGNLDDARRFLQNNLAYAENAPEPGTARRVTQPEKTPTDGTAPTAVRYSRAPVFGSEIDKIRDDDIRTGTRRAFDEREDLAGAFANKPVNDLRKFKESDIADVMEKRLTAYRTKTPKPTFYGPQKVIDNILTRHFHDVADAQSKAGYGRAITKSDSYVPEMIDLQAVDILQRKANSPEADAIRKAIEAHHAKAGLPKEESDRYIRALTNGTMSPDDTAAFGALRRAAGVGLPKSATVGGRTISIREANPTRLLERYGRRVAKDMAWFKNVENPLSAKLNDPAYADPSFTAARESFIGRPLTGSDAMIKQVMRIFSAAKLGVTGGVVNLVQIPQFATPYLKGDLGIPLKAAANIAGDLRGAMDRAINAGALRPGNADKRFADIISADAISDRLGAIATALRKIGLREYTDRATRIWAFEIGRLAATKAAVNGDRQFFQNLDTPFGEVDRAASRITDRIEGTYDVRELPAWMTQGKYGDFVSLLKWSVGRGNRVIDDILKPAKNGNPLPLLTYLGLAMGVSIPATKELTELFNNAKQYDPTLEELEETDASSREYALWLSQAARIASLGGIYTDLLNYAAQRGLAGDKRAQLIYNPAAQGLSDSVPTLISDYIEALLTGEDPLKAGQVLGNQFLRQSMQSYALVANQLDERKEDKDKLRDLRTYRRLTDEDYKAGSYNPPNPALDLDEKEFKRAKTPEAAMEVLEGILAKYQEKYGNDPYLLRRKLDALKRNSYQTFPTEAPEAAKYFDFLARTQGEEAARERLADFLRQQSLNRAKTRGI